MGELLNDMGMTEGDLVAREVKPAQLRMERMPVSKDEVEQEAGVQD